eukprot:jgi/Ulvmu1/11498/UM077_0047.1
MSAQAVASAVDAFCTQLEETHLMTSDSQFIEANRHDIAAVVETLDENDRKLRMIDNYMDDWRSELAKLKKLRDAAVQRRDMLQDVAQAMRKAFPAVRIGDQSNQIQPAMDRPSAPFSLRGHRGHLEAASTSVQSLASSGPARPQDSASVLREVINHAAAVGTAQAQASRARKEVRRAPLPLVSKKELEACGRHLVGRLTELKVNAALEELAGFAEQNAKDIQKLRNPKATFRDARKRLRLQDLESLARNNPCMQSRMWFLQSDTKRGTVVKFDKSGQALLQVLRHLKRVSEIRCRLAGEADIVYVYEDQA